MMSSWMGSHFTNDDIVRESRLEDDYDFEIASAVNEAGAAVYHLTLLPKPEAPVVWGKIVVEVTPDPLLPVWQAYYDEEGALEPEITPLHTNACGDFQLIARDDWFALRGYPEFDGFSLHIDSLFEHAAHHSGVVDP